jgi:hypothetical protein
MLFACKFYLGYGFVHKVRLVKRSTACLHLFNWKRMISHFSTLQMAPD